MAEHDNALASHPGRADEGDADLSSLEATIDSKLAELNDDSDDSDGAGIDDGAEGSDATGGTPNSDEPGTEPEEAAEDDSDDGAEPDGEDPDEQTPAAASDSPTLPDAFRRTLAAYGWGPDEIDRNLEAMGPEFVAVASRLHQQRTAELAQFAQAGRQATAQPSTPPEAATAPEGQTGDGEQMLSPLDPKALKDEFGDDALIDKLVGPLNKVIHRINAAIPMIESGQNAVTAAQEAEFGRIVDGFFQSDPVKPYGHLYGDGQSPLTSEQQQAREKLLMTADALNVGLQQQGRPASSIEEVLLMAHDLVSASHREQVTRNNLRNAAQTRRKGTTLRPKSGQKPASADDGRALESKVQDRLNEIVRQHG